MVGARREEERGLLCGYNIGCASGVCKSVAS